jgi:hypothetical protein
LCILWLHQEQVGFYDDAMPSGIPAFPDMEVYFGTAVLIKANHRLALALQMQEYALRQSLGCSGLEAG